jgi:hypothetical protein
LRERRPERVQVFSLRSRIGHCGSQVDTPAPTMMSPI